MDIPFVDLKAQYESIKSNIDGAIEDVLNNTAFIGGTNGRGRAKLNSSPRTFNA